MSTLTIILTLLVALEHLYIMFLETVATRSQHTSKTFSIERDELGNHHISTLLKNQGVYNGLLAILLIVAGHPRFTLDETVVRLRHPCGSLWLTDKQTLHHSQAGWGSNMRSDSQLSINRS